MDNQSSCLKFAIIGHQETWEQAQNYVNNIRVTSHSDLLCIEKIKEVYSYIPPRNLFEININSKKVGNLKGVYIETFIAPDELNQTHLRKNIGKVKDACKLAAKMGVSIVSLGGFSSIVLESGNESFSVIDNTFFTTGNTLTAAFITNGVEKACSFWKQSLADSNVLIIGSTGDIGSACVAYFSRKVKTLLLCARQPGPLKKQSIELTSIGVKNEYSVNLKELVHEADIIISVASSIIDQNDLDSLSQHTIICDAGYPKNILGLHIKNHERMFYGGMGYVEKGFAFENNAQESLYNFSVPHCSHACLLESVVLAMEENYIAFSKGKGNITIESMENILQMAEKHGIETAPLFNDEKIIQSNKNIVYE